MCQTREASVDLSVAVGVLAGVFLLWACSVMYLAYKIHRFRKTHIWLAALVKANAHIIRTAYSGELYVPMDGEPRVNPEILQHPQDGDDLL